MEKKTVYYNDEINDDFAGNNIKTISIPSDYKYVGRGILWHVVEFIFYYIIACPCVALYNIVWHREKIVNKKVLKGYRKGGFYLYGNHTMVASDAFTPSRITFPKKANIIINPDGVSIPVVGRMVEFLGGVPIATDLKGMKNFSNAIKVMNGQNKAIVIYPEAHIWPYYNKIRPFKDVSFKYPAEGNKPVFCFTKVYGKRKIGKRPKVTVYIDGPYFPDENLTVKENQKMLRNKCYEAMTKRAEDSYEYVKYVKIEQEIA